ncbi:MerR family transcriptional regulator [Nocardiopsis alba]|uniref:MerR family transcriptional regulator n=1 Tax=Nocardiopsis alba TaxID=53437 RepID=UPI0033A67CDC
MRIGELSRRTGASPRSLRHYEDQGLISSRRTSGGHREYGEETLERVDRVRGLLGAGLNLATIRDLLPCLYARERGEPAPDLLDHLCAERERVTRSIHELEHMREALDSVIHQSADTGGALAGGSRAEAAATLADK